MAASEDRYQCDYESSSLLSCKTVVAVEVQDIKNGATHYWTLSKLR